MKYRTPLANVRGLGSAKEGTHHFWVQRVTAVALVPLGLWFLVGLITVTSSDYTAAAEWLRSPISTVLCIALIVATFYHAYLGMQVVLEDYIHTKGLKLVALLALKFACALMGTASVVAVLRISLGS